MKCIVRAFVLGSFAAVTCARANPVNKALQLLSDLTAKITNEQKNAQHTFAEFKDWCEDRTTNLGFEIQTGNSEVASLQALIEDSSARQTSLGEKIQDLGSALATDDADLKAASGIRSKESADFGASSKELNEVIDTLTRAIGILERQGGASMVQLNNAGDLAKALSVMVDASSLTSADAARLTAMVQTSQATEDADDNADFSLGAPDSAVYKSHSDSILETLEDLLDKARAQLRDAQQKETSAQHNFEMLRQSLEDGMTNANKDMADAKKDRAAAAEKRAAGQGDLAATSKELQADTDALAGTKHVCGQKASDFDASKKSREQELAALAEATKALSDMTGGASAISYGLNQVSFIQRSQVTSGSDLARLEIVRLLRDLARKNDAPALTQLASRVASVMDAGAGADVFGKVRTLIANLIDKLEGGAAADSSHKAFCDKELSESTASKDEKTSLANKLSTKVDQLAAQSAHLGEEVAALRGALAKLASSQAEMNRLRKAENTAYVSNKAEMEAGVQGVQLALRVLREYYSADGKAHDAADGASHNIIGLLEVVESDFSKDLASIVVTENAAQASFEEQTQTNSVEKAMKEQDVKYKERESTSLQKRVSELSSDKAGVQSELDAVVEYLGKIEEQCVAKAETYSARSERRTAEIAGLKQALDILEAQSSFVQVKSSLRGVARHHRL